MTVHYVTIQTIHSNRQWNEGQSSCVGVIAYLVDTPVYQTCLTTFQSANKQMHGTALRATALQQSAISLHKTL